MVLGETTGLEEPVQVAQIFVAVVVVLGVGVAWRQLLLASRARRGQVIATVLETLQTTEARKNRKLLHGVTSQDSTEWSDEQRDAAEQVCQAFNTVAFMVDKDLVEKDLVLDNWRAGVRDCWAKAKPLVDYRRATEAGNERLWHHFEWLASEAVAETFTRPQRIWRWLWGETSES